MQHYRGHPYTLRESRNRWLVGPIRKLPRAARGEVDEAMASPEEAEEHRRGAELLDAFFDYGKYEEDHKLALDEAMGANPTELSTQQQVDAMLDVSKNDDDDPDGMLPHVPPSTDPFYQDDLSYLEALANLEGSHRPLDAILQPDSIDSLQDLLQDASSQLPDIYPELDDGNNDLEISDTQGSDNDIAQDPSQALVADTDAVTMQLQREYEEHHERSMSLSAANDGLAEARRKRKRLRSPEQASPRKTRARTAKLELSRKDTLMEDQSPKTNANHGAHTLAIRIPKQEHAKKERFDGPNGGTTNGVIAAKKRGMPGGKVVGGHLVGKQELRQIHSHDHATSFWNDIPESGTGLRKTRAQLAAEKAATDEGTDDSK